MFILKDIKEKEEEEKEERKTKIDYKKLILKNGKKRKKMRQKMKCVLQLRHVNLDTGPYKIVSSTFYIR